MDGLAVVQAVFILTVQGTQPNKNYNKLECGSCKPNSPAKMRIPRGILTAAPVDIDGRTIDYSTGQLVYTERYH
jgi:predicted aldo/keto reductase-like oxidoreductase